MKATLIVSDTSPLRALNHIGLIGLLQHFFPQVLVPPAVAAELAQQTQLFSPLDLTPWPFIRVQPVADLSRAQMLLGTLHLGESQAIALALEIGAKYLLIDERQGRSVAASVGLVPLGVVGVLGEAKAAKLIPAIGPLLDKLVTQINFRLSPALRDVAIKMAGE
jgi:hypothetical protein